MSASIKVENGQNMNDRFHPPIIPTPVPMRHPDGFSTSTSGTSLSEESIKTVKIRNSLNSDLSSTDRVIHKIHLPSLRHNYRVVESTACRQRCSVIAVVKADAYGHGASEVARHLADYCGCDAFAVATLEEAITLRKALNESCPPPLMRFRVLVLGPPVGYPRCFDLYYHYNVEVMVSGPEVARALESWVNDAEARKWNEVEKAATDSKAEVMVKETQKTDNLVAVNLKLVQQAATLSNVSGHQLAREVRAILTKQLAVANTPLVPIQGSGQQSPKRPTDVQQQKEGTIFPGIEAVAKTSRDKQGIGGDCSNTSTPPSSVLPGNVLVRKRLRWHALVDSGMGRLGFKTDRILDEHEKIDQDADIAEVSKSDETVSIIQGLYNAEIHDKAPIEFYGMCTHMADATSTSTYTCSQMSRFLNLLHQIRDKAHIPVPTVSTDNSAALLTTSLTHFQPSEILSPNTRGYVRVGGALYGQRPAFTSLKPISTLVASVRHVAIFKKGESVGYNRAYIAPQNVRIATLTIGFADGYPRELGNGVGRVSIRGVLFPVAGNVCMDMLMVELGAVEEVDGPGAHVMVGDTAVLWGPENGDEKAIVRLQDVAATMDTTLSDLTCGVDKTRVQRIYTN